MPAERYAQTFASLVRYSLPMLFSSAERVRFTLEVFAPQLNRRAAARMT